jgi:hypothetical protein
MLPCEKLSIIPERPVNGIANKTDKAKKVKSEITITKITKKNWGHGFIPLKAVIAIVLFFSESSKIACRAQKKNRSKSSRFFNVNNEKKLLVAF